MTRSRLHFALTGILLTACVGGGTDPVLGPTPPDAREAPLEALIGEVTVRLEAYLWRDFAPISPPDGKPLIAVLRVRSVDGGAIPPTVRADTVWVLNGTTAWIAPVMQEQPAPDPSYFEVVARDGPTWGPGIEVDVILLVRDAAGQRIVLRAPAQPIHRTD